MTLHRRLIELNLHSYRPLRLLPLTLAHCRVTLQWCLARSGWNHDDWRHIVFRDKSRFQLSIIEDVSGDAQGSVPILFSLFQATQALNQGLWSGLPFLLIAGPLWSSLETHLLHRGTSTPFCELLCYRYSEALWPYFSARYC
ncbi:hypothetical protein TNCV_2985971 [Trichonephila clavipes]|nr:hypothetical protein TNCV_2985971 [Trichonephila clavipes]